MKKRNANRMGPRGGEILGPKLKPRDRKILKDSLNQVNEQVRRLGILDPMEVEPSIIYLAEAGRR